MRRATVGTRPTLRDVARAAGVSASIASKVVNGSSEVSVRPETRARILAAASDLGYRAHAAARVLAGAPTRVLALLIPELTSPVYATMVRGAYQRAEEQGYTVLLAEDLGDRQTDERFRELVESGRVDGLIIASVRSDDHRLRTLDPRWVPHVYVNRSVPGSGSNVVMEVGAASHLAVEHLLSLGHRRIGHIGGPDGIETARARARSFRAALRRAGLPPGPVVLEPFDEPGGAHGMRRLLAESRPTAVYTSSFGQAVGALHECRRSGVSVPESVSVVSADELPAAGYLDPPLTTIEMPLAQLGRTAVDALLARLRGQPLGNVVIPTTPRLIRRRSTAERLRGA